MIQIVKRNNVFTYGIKEYVIDTAEELNNLPKDILMGSKVYIISTNQNFIKNGNGEWIET